VPLILLLACRPGGHVDSEPDTQPALSCPIPAEGPTRSVVVSVQGVAIELWGDASPTRDETPVVILGGSFEPDQVPSTAATRLADGHALLQVHLDLPGAEGEPTTSGEYDRFGEGSRAAVSIALAYAAGILEDDQGCTLPQRAVLASDPVLIGVSNGGNLAVASLAESTAPVAALLLWETPAAAQFVTSELHDPEFQGCTLGDKLICRSDLSQAVVDSEGVFLDRDGSGAQNDSEPRFSAIRVGQMLMYSPSLHKELGPQDGLAGLEASEAWFELREAASLADEAVGQHPDLRVMLVASKQDHVQRLSWSPHVIGVGAAFDQAGAWVRLNPDTRFSGLDEHDANVGFSLTDPGALLPGFGKEDRILWGVQELIERLDTDDWSPDLAD
jgi:hypothetical protein